MTRLDRSRWLVLVLSLSIGSFGCAGEPTEEPAPEAEAEATAAAEPAVLEVVLADYSFTAPPSVPAGWTTIRMRNDGEEPHFLSVWQLPEGVQFADYAENVPPLFAQHHARFAAGEITADELMAAIGGGLPAWFGDVHGAGGVGLTSPGHTGEVVVNLAPGEYVMECYVRSADGRFHAEQGMLRPLMVTEPATSAPEPTADIELILSNYRIMVADGELTAGDHTVAVTASQMPEGIIGHDVHLVRLTEGASIDEVVAWMNWMTALQAPSPAPAVFLGGADDAGIGRTSYFRVTLEPGRYAWISEGYAAQGMVHEFVVE